VRAISRALPTLVLVLVAAAALFPLGVAISAALSPEQQLFAATPLWPSHPTLEHVRALFATRDFWTPVRNSLVVAGATTLVTLPLAAACAYAIARLRFAGARAIAALLLIVGMFPQISIVSPLYLSLRRLGLIDSYPGLVLPYVTFALPLAVWLLTAYLERLPPDLEEAAQLDGASRLRAMVEIVLPLAAPGLLTTAILTFIYAWNELLFALSFTTGPERRTVPVAIALYRGQYQVPWGQILAGALIATTPVALLVLVFQRRIVSGLTGGAVKE
jgi:ABC-type glycerol-3-phosphate transport system permease component